MTWALRGKSLYLKLNNVTLDPKVLHFNKSVFHEPAVEKYMDDIDKGKKIERIVVESIRGMILVRSGNHRGQAHLRKGKKIKAKQLATTIFGPGEPWVDPFKE